MKPRSRASDPSRIVAIALGAAFLLAAPAARAERREFPLSQLVGELDPEYGFAPKEIEFTLPVRPLEVKWVELRLRGSSFPGATIHYVWNDVVGAEVPEVVRIPTSFTAYIPTSAGEWVAYSGPNPMGVFDHTSRFARNPGSDRELSWDFLREGHGTILLYADAPVTWGGDPLMPASKIGIEQAVLIVEGKWPSKSQR